MTVGKHNVIIAFSTVCYNNIILPLQKSHLGRKNCCDCRTTFQDLKDDLQQPSQSHLKENLKIIHREKHVLKKTFKQLMQKYFYMVLGYGGIGVTIENIILKIIQTKKWK